MNWTGTIYFFFFEKINIIQEDFSLYTKFKNDSTE